MQPCADHWGSCGGSENVFIRPYATFNLAHVLVTEQSRSPVVARVRPLLAALALKACVSVLDPTEVSVTLSISDDHRDKFPFLDEQNIAIDISRAITEKWRLLERILPAVK